MLRELKWPSLQQRRKYYCNHSLYKVVRNLMFYTIYYLPTYLIQHNYLFRYYAEFSSSATSMCLLMYIIILIFQELTI